MSDPEITTTFICDHPSWMTASSRCRPETSMSNSPSLRTMMGLTSPALRIDCARSVLCPLE